MLQSPFATLGPIEVDYDHVIADARYQDVLLHRRMNRARVVENDNELDNHLIGAHGEHAFAKWLGTIRQPSPKWGRCRECECYTGTVNTFSVGADVGRYQVRTRRKNEWPLIVRESDKDDDVFVLVTVRTWEAWRDGMVPTKFEMMGWITGRDAKLVGAYQDPGERRPAWFVTADQLQPMMWLPADTGGRIGQEALAAAHPAT